MKKEELQFSLVPRDETTMKTILLEPSSSAFAELVVDAFNKASTAFNMLLLPRVFQPSPLYLRREGKGAVAVLRMEGLRGPAVVVVRLGRDVVYGTRPVPEECLWDTPLEGLLEVAREREVRVVKERLGLTAAVPFLEV